VLALALIATQKCAVLTVLLHVTDWHGEVEGMFTVELYAAIRHAVMI
jgi:hypothetical protein